MWASLGMPNYDSKEVPFTVGVSAPTKYTCGWFLGPTRVTPTRHLNGRRGSTETCLRCTISSVAAVFTDASEMSSCYSVDSKAYCFYASDSSGDLSWSDAREFCEARNSTLPTPADDKVDSVIQRFIDNDANSVIQNSPVCLSVCLCMCLSVTTVGPTVGLWT